MHQKYTGRVVLRREISRRRLRVLQYSLNKDLQHLKLQLLKSWISSPDCLVAMDKEQAQYQLIPK